MRRNGLEKMNLCGRVMAGCNERRRHEENEAPLAAFSTIDLNASVRNKRAQRGLEESRWRMHTSRSVLLREQDRDNTEPLALSLSCFQRLRQPRSLTGL